MDTLKKSATIEPVSLIPSAEEELHRHAGEVTLYEDMPSGDGETIRYIGDADAVLVSCTSRISRHVIESCPSIRYVNICRNPYSKKSANVDTVCAKERGITVLGIRDYGNRGVVEYMFSELMRFLHGLDCSISRDMPVEITDLKMGIIGMGMSGGMTTDVLKFTRTSVSYYSRSREQDREDQRMTYRPLKKLLDRSGVVFTRLNKNMILLHEKEFRQLEQGKLLFNTSIGPAFDPPALEI